MFITNLFTYLFVAIGKASQNGKDGTCKIVVDGKTINSIYTLNIIKCKITACNGGDTIIPGEDFLVSEIEIFNYGDIPTPNGCSIYMSDFKNCEIIGENKFELPVIPSQGSIKVDPKFHCKSNYCEQIPIGPDPIREEFKFLITGRLLDYNFGTSLSDGSVLKFPICFDENCLTSSNEKILFSKTDKNTFALELKTVNTLIPFHVNIINESTNIVVDNMEIITILDEGKKGICLTVSGESIFTNVLPNSKSVANIMIGVTEEGKLYGNETFYSTLSYKGRPIQIKKFAARLNDTYEQPDFDNIPDILIFTDNFFNELELTKYKNIINGLGISKLIIFYLNLHYLFQIDLWE